MTGKYPIILALISLFLFSTCKKGEDDPKISLRTRKARLTGDWSMTSGKASFTQTGYNESYSFDGSNLKINVTSPNYPVVYTGKYTLNLTISKDGKFNFKEFIAGSMIEAKGTWNFNTGVGEDKAKEDVVFSIDEVEHGYTRGEGMFTRYQTNFVYKIQELRNKTLVINSSGKVYSDSQGNYMTFSTNYVFQQ